MKFKLYKAAQLRTRLILLARRKITSDYAEASAKLKERADRIANRAPNDAVLNVGDYEQVEKEARERYKKIREDQQSSIVRDMNLISVAAFNEFYDFFISYGAVGAPESIVVPKSVVQNILNGTVYEKPDNLGYRDFNWGLSKTLWGDNRKTIADIHRIIAEGVARGAGAMEIAQDIERYTNPNKDKSKQFEWKKVYPGTKTKIDYNASRLARTMLNHAYQQSFKEAGEHNPWISHYIWNSAFAHGRTCQVCMDLDGQLFAKDNDTSGRYPPLPLDHPNGLCDWTYEFDDANMVQDMRNYENGTGDPELNERIEEYYRYLREG